MLLRHGVLGRFFMRVHWNSEFAKHSTHGWMVVLFGRQQRCHFTEVKTEALSSDMPSWSRRGKEQVSDLGTHSSATPEPVASVP